MNPNGTNGSDRVIYHLVETMQAMGHEMYVLGFSDKPILSIGRATVRHLPPPRTRYVLPGALTHALSKANPDLVHLHSPYDLRNLLLAGWLQRKRIPFAVSPHGSLMPGTFMRRRAARFLVVNLIGRPLLGRASVVHAVSHAEARAVLRFAPQARVVVAPHGLEGICPGSLDVSYLRRRLPSLRGKRVFGFLGRLDPLNKGLDLLVEGCALAREALGQAAVVLAGPDWRGRTAALRHRVDQLGLSDIVIFLGPLDTGPAAAKEKFDFLASCDIFVHPSRWEAGIPFSVLDAIEVGKPCLVTELDFFGDFFRRYRAGVQVAPTAEGIAERLAYFSRASEEELRAMGSEARGGALSEFSWEKTATKLVRAYSEARPHLAVANSARTLRYP